MESQLDPLLGQEHLYMLQQRNVDGVILFGFTGLMAPMLDPWQEKMVVIAREYEGSSSVCYDDAGAVKLLMAHLHQQGPRHISYLGVQLSDATTGQRRYHAYLKTCEHLQLTLHAALGELPKRFSACRRDNQRLQQCVDLRL